VPWFNFNKKTIFVFLFLCSLIFVYSGQLSSVSDVQVIRTTYFDFIFPKKSEQSAVILSKEADKMYEEIATLLHTDIKLHIPVVITPDNDELNAYYTPIPYNRIVVYDTIPTINSLAVFSESLCSVFYHELVHAISINIRSPFWGLASDIIGDVVTPSMMINLPTSFIEGVTVSFESLYGEGRLNDVYSLHMLKQAKIENKFPSWSDIAGSRDISPAGALPYLFGGAFSAYLQQKFGMEKYAEFWQESGKLHIFTFSPGIFKKVYNTSIDSEWKLFQDTIDISSSIINPTAFSSKVKKGWYGGLCSAQGMIGTIDNQTGLVTILKDDEKIYQFVSDLTEKISFSMDGRYIVLSGTTSISGKKRNTIKIYDLIHKQYIKTPIIGLRDGAIVTLSDNSKVLIGVETVSQKSAIVSIPFEEIEKGKISTRTYLSFFDVNIIPFSLEDAGNNSFVYFLKDKQEWSIIVNDFLHNSEKKYYLKDDAFVPQSLSVADSKLYISCVFEETMIPTLGIFDLKTEKMYVSDEIYSGGVYSPVLLDSRIVFVSHFFEERQLSSTEFSLIREKEITLNIPRVDEEGTVTPFIHKKEKYNPLMYLSKGIIALFGPLSLNLDSFRLFNEPVLAGISYVTMDPAEICLFVAGLGIDVITPKVNISTGISYSFRNTTTSLDLFSSWNEEGLDKSAIQLQNSLAFPLNSQYSNFILSNNFVWLYEDIHELTNELAFQYSYLKKWDSGYSVLGGFLIGVQGNFYFNQKNHVSEKYPSVIGKIYIPKLLPVQNTVKLTLSLPSTITSIFQYNNFVPYFYLNGEMQLVSIEIQKGTKLVPLYMRRIVFYSGLNNQWNNWVEKKRQGYLTASFDFTPNTGVVIGQSIAINFNLFWDFLNDTNSKPLTWSVSGNIAL
jgi:hypothetical protein